MFKKRTIKKADGMRAKRKIIEQDLNDETSLMKSSTSKLNKPSTVKVDMKTKPAPEPIIDATLSHHDQATVDIQQPSTQGPLKPLPVNVRTTTITDFQPDVCKDFQQTGYCGYGDTCKFLHIRGDSINKKPVVKEWENVNHPKPTATTTIPYKCVLCKQDYKYPVQTVCNHVFCKDCFFKRNKQHKTCIICHSPTEGICSPVTPKQLATMINTE